LKLPKQPKEGRAHFYTSFLQPFRGSKIQSKSILLEPAEIYHFLVILEKNRIFVLK
jgi:hypothetical protein